MSIGEQIKELLYEQKITQKQLAQDLNIPVTTLNGYIRDFREPDVAMLKSIATYFNVTIDYLLDFNLAQSTPGEKSLNAPEMELLRVYRCLKKEQQELLYEKGKLMLKLDAKKARPSSATTSKNGIAKNKGVLYS